jgi:hypothetical protein
MTDYLLGLKDRDQTFRWCGRDSVVVDQAYDLTMAKFHDIPLDSHHGLSSGSSDGPNCQYYYKAFHDHIAKEFQERPPTSIIDEEVRAADAFQRMVARHFYLSCLECRRRAAKLVRRYAWKVNGDQLVLWLPVEMSGSRCRAWLRNNVPDLDLSRPGERDRVQAIVDRLLARRRIFSLDELQETGPHIGVNCTAAPLTYAGEISAAGLAHAVAEEKAENIDDQRPAIRALGRDKLKDLICRIFESLAEDRHAEQIAADFGLSKPTFSRFAGCKWTRDVSETSRMPDLWQNVAHVLVAQEDFVAVARQAGVWDRVCRAAGTTDSARGETE